MHSALLLRRMGNSLRRSLLRDYSRKQNLHSNCSAFCKLIRSISTDVPMDFEVKELQADVPGCLINKMAVFNSITIGIIVMAFNRPQAKNALSRNLMAQVRAQAD